MKYSHSTVVDNIVALSKKASYASEIVEQLVDAGITFSAKTSVFAEEIFDKVEHMTSRPNMYQQQEREVAKFAHKQKNCLRRKIEIKKFRKRSKTREDTDDEVVKHESKQRRVRSWNSHDEKMMALTYDYIILESKLNVTCTFCVKYFICYAHFHNC